MHPIAHGQNDVHTPHSPSGGLHCRASEHRHSVRGRRSFRNVGIPARTSQPGALLGRHRRRLGRVFKTAPTISPLQILIVPVHSTELTACAGPLAFLLALIGQVLLAIQRRKRTAEPRWIRDFPQPSSPPIAPRRRRPERRHPQIPPGALP